MRTSAFFFLLIPFLLFFLNSCSKGYEIRCTNYSTEPMDSVIIGNKKIVFVNVPRLGVSHYSSLKSGSYTIELISSSKKHYRSSVSIAKSGSGKRSIQIDGTGAVSILED